MHAIVHFLSPQKVVVKTYNKLSQRKLLPGLKSFYSAHGKEEGRPLIRYIADKNVSTSNGFS
jgi:hypothetical protein